MDLEELLSGIWEKLNATELSPTMYQYYEQLFHHRTIVLNDDISEHIVEHVYLPLKAFEEDDSTEPVTLILNSSGGSVSDGFFLAYYISQYSKPLNIQVLGYACSMATVLLAAGGKNENIIRSCYPCSYVLIRDGYVALAAAESKTAADIMAFNNEIDEKIRQFFLDNTNLTAEEYDKHARHQWFLFADKMKEKNLIDKIIGVDEE